MVITGVTNIVVVVVIVVVIIIIIIIVVVIIVIIIITVIIITIIVIGSTITMDYMSSTTIIMEISLVIMRMHYSFVRGD